MICFKAEQVAIGVDDLGGMDDEEGAPHLIIPIA